ncbi:hypothetical protein ACX5K5_15230 [Glutamicibacter bergerei]
MGEHAFVLAAAREQEFVGFVFGEVLEFVPATVVGGGSVEVYLVRRHGQWPGR